MPSHESDAQSNATVENMAVVSAILALTEAVDALTETVRDVRDALRQQETRVTGGGAGHVLGDRP